MEEIGGMQNVSDYSTSIEIDWEAGFDSFKKGMNKLWPVVQMYVYAILGLTIFLGNGIFIVAIAKFRRLNTVTNRYILSILICNVLTSGFLMYYAYASKFDIFQKDRIACLAKCAIIVLVSIKTMMTLLVILAERFMALKEPGVYRSTCKVQGCINCIIIFLWIYALVAAVVPFLLNRWPLVRYCAISILLDRIYLIALLSHFGGFTAISIYLYLYLLIGVKPKLQKRKSMKTTQKKRELERSKLMTSFHYLNAAASMTFTFILCWTPFYVTLLLQVLNVKWSIMNEVQSIALMIGFFGSTLMPVMLVLNVSHFKQTLEKIVCCCDCYISAPTFEREDSIRISKASFYSYNSNQVNICEKEDEENPKIVLSDSEAGSAVKAEREHRKQRPRYPKENGHLQNDSHQRQRNKSGNHLTVPKHGSKPPKATVRQNKRQFAKRQESYGVNHLITGEYVDNSKALKMYSSTPTVVSGKQSTRSRSHSGHGNGLDNSRRHRTFSNNHEHQPHSHTMKNPLFIEDRHSPPTHKPPPPPMTETKASRSDLNGEDPITSNSVKDLSLHQDGHNHGDKEVNIDQAIEDKTLADIANKLYEKATQGDTLGKQKYKHSIKSVKNRTVKTKTETETREIASDLFDM
ncbi:unnamed protein product [Owenia fusiformis]|uniref:Uncharacterized protein n=1 Tax=Owenia fusiformis TaxID=6347 RepID=A0A8J1UA28_OWEFU|nr:unnamed protein product [Owenia fusiformis]